MKQFLYLLLLICALLVVGPIEAKKKKYPNGDYYEGEWKKGAPHGIGTMKYADGSVYEGNWHYGEPNGTGSMKYYNGNNYNGNWEKSSPHGKGIMKYSNGNIYEGNWHYGEPNGTGSMKYINGNNYDGNWMNGEKNGQGTMKYSDGSIYIGYWVEDEMNGQGRWDYKNGKYEEGIWKDGILITGYVDVNLHHNGKYHYDEYFIGTVKEGNYYNGKIHGYYKGAYYQGTFKNGKIYDGIYRKENEIGQINATYSNGEQTEATIKAKDGWLFKGKIENDLPYNNGIITSNKCDSSIELFYNYGCIIDNEGTTSRQDITKHTRSSPIMFNRWVNDCFDIQIKKQEEKYEEEQEEEERERLRVEAIFKQNQQKVIKEQKAREEEIKWSKIATQIPYYVWEASTIRSIYENNPARFRTLTQYKYIIFNSTITDIEESDEMEYSAIYQDYIRYKLYTVRLSGGVYLETTDTNFVSNLYKGQKAYFVGNYTDKKSYGRTLFTFEMYAGSHDGLIDLMKKRGISLDYFVKRTNY